MEASAAGWKIGFARQSITPPLGSQMAGFDARKNVSTSVHDDLHARALVFDDGRTQTVFVSVEVIAVGPEFSAAVRSRIEAETGIPAAHVFLSATHTHCGPVTINHFFNQGQPLDRDYIDALADSIVQAAKAAYESRQPRLLKTGLVECNGIAVNRRAFDGLPVDHYAGVLLVEEPNGEPAAIAVIYACHTTVLGPDTLSTTQDFPFYTLEKLRTELGPEVETLFFNGAEGDLSIGHKSDLSAVGIIDSFRTFETARRLGEKLADAVLVGLPSLTAEPPLVEVLAETISLPLKQYQPLTVMTKAREEALSQIRIDDFSPEMLAKRQRSLFARIEEYYAKLYEKSDAAQPKHLAAELSAIRLGETAFLTLAGEVFVRIALTIRESSPFHKTLFLGLTNDYIGYVPDQEATAASGYEVVASRVPAQGGVILQEAAAVLLQKLKAKAASRQASTS
jgi:neutral ceramidase